MDALPHVIAPLLHPDLNFAISGKPTIDSEASVRIRPHSPLITGRIMAGGEEEQAHRRPST